MQPPHSFSYMFNRRHITRMLRAAPLITAKTVKQPKGPSAGEWVNQPKCEYYTAVEMSELRLHTSIWKTLM